MISPGPVTMKTWLTLLRVILRISQPTGSGVATQT